MFADQLQQEIERAHAAATEAEGARKEAAELRQEASRRQAAAQEELEAHAAMAERLKASRDGMASGCEHIRVPWSQLVQRTVCNS